jgi:hypothetical protein
LLLHAVVLGGCREQLDQREPQPQKKQGQNKLLQAKAERHEMSRNRASSGKPSGTGGGASVNVEDNGTPWPRHPKTSPAQKPRRLIPIWELSLWPRRASGIFLPFQPCQYVTLEVAIDSMPIIQQSNGEPLCL